MNESREEIGEAVSAVEGPNGYMIDTVWPWNTSL